MPIDPIVADGEVFEFDGMLDVPAPRARVDLLEARKEAERQAKTCEMLLEGEADRVKAVLRNSIGWLEFWRVRAPTEELRQKFGESLRRLLDGVIPPERREDGKEGFAFEGKSEGQRSRSSGSGRAS